MNASACARDVYGCATCVLSEHAVTWDAAGALAVALNTYDSREVWEHPAYKLLAAAVEKLGYTGSDRCGYTGFMPVENFSDDKTHAEVMKLYDMAIKESKRG